MQHMPPPIAGETAELEDLYKHLQDQAGADGFYERLDDTHTAQFIDGNDTLLVSFEHTNQVLRRDRAADQPLETLGRRVQNRTECAQLTLLTSDDTWFRAEGVYKFFDDLVDDGFFDEFGHVVFYGAGLAGYAAGAYSVVASDCQVLLIQPQATLTPQAAGWDRRFPQTRRMDFTQRYGYAPNMIETAGFVVVGFDPAFDEDFMHAQLFDRDWVDLLRIRHLGANGAAALEQHGLLDQIVEDTVTEGLSTAALAKTLRKRRETPAYLHAVMDHAEAMGRTGMMVKIANFARLHSDDARFAAPAAQDTAPAAPTASATSAALAVLAVGGALTKAEMADDPEPDTAAEPVTETGVDLAEDTATPEAPPTEAPEEIAEDTSPEAVTQPEAEVEAAEAVTETEEEVEADDTTMMSQPFQPWDSFALARNRAAQAAANEAASEQTDDPAPVEQMTEEPSLVTPTDQPEPEAVQAPEPEAEPQLVEAAPEPAAPLADPTPEPIALEPIADPIAEPESEAPTAESPASEPSAPAAPRTPPEGFRPNGLAAVKAEVQRRRAQSPLRSKTRRPGKRRR